MEFACFLPVRKKKVFVITCGGRYLVLSQRKANFALSVKFLFMLQTPDLTLN